jgi:hypothetical protein
MSALKPCPFCGSPGERWCHPGDRDGYLYSVKCSNLGCGVQTPQVRPEDKASWIWSGRTPIPEQTEAQRLADFRNRFSCYGNKFLQETEAQRDLGTLTAAICYSQPLGTLPAVFAQALLRTVIRLAEKVGDL